MNERVWNFAANGTQIETEWCVRQGHVRIQFRELFCGDDAGGAGEALKVGKGVNRTEARAAGATDDIECFGGDGKKHLLVGTFEGGAGEADGDVANFVAHFLAGAVEIEGCGKVKRKLEDFEGFGIHPDAARAPEIHREAVSFHGDFRRGAGGGAEGEDECGSVIECGGFGAGEEEGGLIFREEEGERSGENGLASRADEEFVFGVGLAVDAEDFALFTEGSWVEGGGRGSAGGDREEKELIFESVGLVFRGKVGAEFHLMDGLESSDGTEIREISLRRNADAREKFGERREGILQIRGRAGRYLRQEWASDQKQGPKAKRGCDATNHRTAWMRGREERYRPVGEEELLLVKREWGGRQP